MSDQAMQRVPVVIVGGGVNGLGVLRSLARARVPALVVAGDANHPAMHSRHGRKVLYRNDGRDALIGTLEQLADGFEDVRPVLMLTEEEVVYRVSAHRRHLRKWYRLTLPTHDVLAALMHKEGFRTLAGASGATIPRARHVTTTGQVEAVSELRPPLVVKPSFRDAGYGAVFRKAYRIDSVAEAQQLLRHILPILPDVTVQEWIEGADSDIYFCLQYITASGRVAASFVGRKIRSWPPQVGGTASCAAASTAQAEALTRRTTEFFSYAGVRGFAGMEYKHDPRDGEFYMVEPTVGRTDYQEEVATLNGVNLPLAAYRAELAGLPEPGPPGAAIPRRARACIWRDRAADRQSAAQNPGMDPWRPDRARTVDSLWRLTDPMPAIRPLMGRAAGRALRLLRGSRRMAGAGEPKA